MTENNPTQKETTDLKLADLVIEDLEYENIKSMTNGTDKIEAEISMYERIKVKYYKNLSSGQKQSLNMEIHKRERAIKQHNW